eukprot:scaffold34582_cov28-Tisochrysis_lutea.AAC.3
MKDDEVCVICADPLADEDASRAPPHTLLCGHRYHATCIIDWFRHGPDSCPLCRSVDFEAHLVPQTASERLERVLLTVAQPNAPPRLRELAARYRASRVQRRTQRQKARELRRAHAPLFKRHRRLTARLERSKQLVRQLADELSNFVHPAVRVPLWPRPRDDGYESSSSDSFGRESAWGVD